MSVYNYILTFFCGKTYGFFISQEELEWCGHTCFIKRFNTPIYCGQSVCINHNIDRVWRE
jgi:hypothetical protein